MDMTDWIKPANCGNHIFQLNGLDYSFKINGTQQIVSGPGSKISKGFFFYPAQSKPWEPDEKST